MTPLEVIKILAENTNETNLQLLNLVSEVEPNYPLLKDLEENYRVLTETFFDKLNEKEQSLLLNCNNILSQVVNIQLLIFQQCVSLQKEQLEKTKLAVDIYQYSINNFQ